MPGEQRRLSTPRGLILLAYVCGEQVVSLNLLTRPLDT